MPAQINHIIFGEEALDQALGADGKALLNQYGNIFRFGTQGPDFFYHNQRTKPAGLKYGLAAHKEGYGRIVKNMVLQALRLRLRDQPSETLAMLNAYILGFTSHAFLDKKTHPYIHYFSGWVITREEETWKYFRCHAFLERILDVLILNIRRGLDIKEYSLLPLVSCGEKLPYPIIKTLLKGLHASYPGMHFKSRDRRRIENAYKDTIYFYTVTDPLNPLYRQMAFARDQRAGDNRRRLALFHPLNIPRHIDFLNQNRSEWIHPCNKNLLYRASFLDLYEEALHQAVSAIRKIWKILKNEGDPKQVEECIGNESLGTGLNEECTLQFSAPLPLPEIIDKMYQELT